MKFTDMLGVEHAIRFRGSGNAVFYVEIDGVEEMIVRRVADPGQDGSPLWQTYLLDMEKLGSAERSMDWAVRMGWMRLLQLRGVALPSERVAEREFERAAGTVLVTEAEARARLRVSVEETSSFVAPYGVKVDGSWVAVFWGDALSALADAEAHASRVVGRLVFQALTLSVESG